VIGQRGGATVSSKNRSIVVKGTVVTIATRNEHDYISLTDMIRAKEGDFFIADWLRNRNTVEFLGVWERVHNPEFNYGEFATIRDHLATGATLKKRETTDRFQSPAQRFEEMQ
jgi:hypothetical protein